MACMCGDTECGSCGTAQGTLEQVEERETAQGTQVVETEPDFCAKCGYEMVGGPDAVCIVTGRGYHAECVGW